MQGTTHVRSLVRLFIGAALLCLAWVVLTSGQASAAERPTASHPRSDRVRSLPLIDRTGLETVLGSALGKSSAPAERSAAHPAKSSKAATSHASHETETANEMRSGATTSTTPTSTPPTSTVPTSTAPTSATIAPVLDLVGATTRSTVDTGLTLVTDVGEVAGSLPVAGEALGSVTDTVVTLVQSLPAVVVPSPIVPLPIGDGTPAQGVRLPGATEAVAAERDPSMARADLRRPHPRDRQTSLTEDGLTPGRHGPPVQVEVPAGPSRPGVPSGPWAPFDSSPALPSQPSSTGGAAQGGGDHATASVSLELPNPSLFGRSSADWRVPRGLPAHPGTQPD